MRSSRCFLFVLALLGSAFLVGCTKEHDPGEKLDVPGYYNGPMKGKGGDTPANSGAQTKAAPE